MDHVGGAGGLKLNEKGPHFYAIFFVFWQFYQIRIHKEPPDLISGGMRVEGVHDVKVGVDHEGRPRSQVDVLLPPVGHVVVRPQPLEPQVPI